MFIFQFLNNKMHNYVKLNITVSKIEKLTTFSQKVYKLRKLRNLSTKELSQLVHLFKNVWGFFQFLNDKIHNYVKQNIIVHFNIQKLKNKHTFLKNIQTE